MQCIDFVVNFKIIKHKICEMKFNQNNSTKQLEIWKLTQIYKQTCTRNENEQNIQSEMWIFVCCVHFRHSHRNHIPCIVTFIPLRFQAIHNNFIAFQIFIVQILVSIVRFFFNSIISMRFDCWNNNHRHRHISRWICVWLSISIKLIRMVLFIHLIHKQVSGFGAFGYFHV